MRGRLLGLLVIVAMLAAGLLVSGCGGGSSSSSGSTEETAATTTEEESGSTGGQSEEAGGKEEGAGKTFVYAPIAGSTDFLEGLKASFVPDFEKASGFNVALDNFCCGIDKLKTQEEAGGVTWDSIAWATQIEFEEAKENGLLEKLDKSKIDLSKLEPGAYDEYGYATWKTGTVVAWLPGTFPKGQEPTTFEDLFNTEKFPGKRCLYKYPNFGGTLEGALLAEGVKPEELYPLDLEKAFGKLESMSSEIVWWTSGAQAAQFLLNGTCKMAAMWNGVAQTTTARGNPIEIAWPHAITFIGYNAIPKDAPNPEAAQEFLGELIDNTKAQEKFYEHTAYTIPLKEPSIPASVQKWAPEGENVAEAIPEDETYYREHNAEVTKAFNNFLITGG